MDKQKVYFIDLPVNNKPRYVCDITEKIYSSKLSCTIYCAAEQSAQLLDKLLWTWKQESFVPHTICPSTPISDTLPEPILITSKLPIEHQTDALILFDPPEDRTLFSSYRIIIDFAETYDEVKIKQSRKRYKDLLDSGEYELNYLKLSEFLKKTQL